ncbi:MAG: hypothetical protein JO208_09795 [Alphaproteobacteria bacterium]|nr:hypothetical protein [Alphaproteobacteria bacterium]
MDCGKLAGVAAALLLTSGAARADVAISNKPTTNMDCEAGVCTATAQKAVLNVSDLASMLSTGDVAVKTGTVAKDIDLDQPLTWSNASRLTLDAQRSVQIDKQLTVAGQGALTVTTNDAANNGKSAKGKNAGEFIIAPERGSVQFWDPSSSLIIDGQSYTLVYDIKTLASDIAANPSGFYALAKPYDASADGAYGSSPIATEFAGVFEGLGNATSHLTMGLSSDEAQGFFAHVAPNGTVRDGGLSDVKVEGSDFFIVGSFVGENEGTIKYSWATGTMRYADAFGNSLGGLVGTNLALKGRHGVIEHCFANMDIVLGKYGPQHGGVLVGINDGTLSETYSKGLLTYIVAASADAGGLAGANFGSINNSFSVVAIKDGRKNSQIYFGGLVGKNFSSGTAARSYAAGRTRERNDVQTVLGGFVGFDDAPVGSLSATYWDLDKGISDPSQGAGNLPNDPGITGLTGTQLKSGLPEGFDPEIWTQSPGRNLGLPYLISLPIH